MAAPLIGGALPLVITDNRPTEPITSGAYSNSTYYASFEVRLDIPSEPLPSSVCSGLLALATDGRQTDTDVSKAIQNDRQQFFAYCAEDVKSWSKDDIDSPQYTRHINGKVTFLNVDYLGYSIAIEDYKGCPCGSGAVPVVSNATWNCTSGRRLKASDLVEKSNERKLLNLIRGNLAKLHTNSWEFAEFVKPETRTDAELAEAVSCAFKGAIGAPFVSDNFCFTTNGIQWTFNACEIVCGSWGMVDVIVPWTTAKPLLRSSIKVPRTGAR